jgi:excisionase family DNA binding protein
VPIALNARAGSIRLPEHFKNQDQEHQDIPSQLRKFKKAISAATLADLLDFTVSHILKQAKRGRIPSYRLGGSVKFDPIRVADWLEARAM